MAGSPQVTITRRLHFSAAHRVHNPALSEAERAEIDAAIARLDRGEGVPMDELKTRLAAKLKAAGA